METRFERFLRKAIGGLVYLFIFLLPWQTKLILRSSGSPYQEISLYFSLGLLLLIMVLFLVSRWRDKIEDEDFCWPAYALAAVELLGIVSLFFAPDKILGAYRYFVLLCAISLFLIIQLGFRHGNYQEPVFERTKAAYSFLAGAFIQALIGISQFLSQSSFACKYLGLAAHDPAVPGTSVIEAAGGRWLRAYGGLDHPNILGGFLALALIVAANLLAEKRTENRKRRGLISISLFLAYFIILYGLIFTFSRAAWAAFAVGSLVLLAVYFFRKDRWAAGRQLAVIFFSLVFFSIAILPFRDLALVRFDLDSRLEQQSLSEREIYLEQSLPVIESRFFTGTGLGNYTVFLQRQDKTIRPAWEYQPVHNAFLLFFAETGIFSLLAFLSFVFLLFRGDRARPLSWAILSVLVVIALCDHWLVSLVFGNLLLFLVLAFA